MKERVSIRRTTSRGYLAINTEAIGKERGAVFSIIYAAMTGGPPQLARQPAPKRHRRD